jgi:predicted nucleic acid-binding protein
VKYALVDTVVLHGMFDKTDQHHQAALAKADALRTLHLVLPWPIVYEAIRTRLARNTFVLSRFEHFLKISAVTYLDDSPYREAALELAFDSSLRRKRPLSMVDCLVRLLIEDVNVRVDYLATDNIRDFVDVCRTHSVQII